MFRTIVLPAFNESGYIAEMVRHTLNAGEMRPDPFEVIVVDNASTDDTAAIAEEIAAADPRVQLIRHPENRLYAASCQSGTRAAKGDRIFILDSDGQHSPADLWNFDSVLDDGFDIVFGRRIQRQETFRRLLLSRVLGLVTWWYLRYPLHDVNCGFRAFTRQFGDELEIVHRVNYVNAELYVRARIGGFRIGEASTVQEKRKAGTTSHDFSRLWQIWHSVNSYLSSLANELRLAGSDASVRRSVEASP